MFGWMLGASDEVSRPPNIEEVYLKYRRLMFATAGKFTSNVEDQKDIVQTAVERLIKIFSVLGAKTRCISAGYIVFTVRSVSIDLLRKQGREAAHYVSIEDEQLDRTASSDSPLEDLMILKDRSKKLWDIWSQLSPEEQILLEGKYILDLTNEELATILNCKAASIRMKLTRARRRAAKLLTERSPL